MACHGNCGNLVENPVRRVLFPLACYLTGAIRGRIRELGGTVSWFSDDGTLTEIILDFVEDHEETANVLKKVVKKCFPSATLSYCVNLKESWESLGRSSFDLALIDLGLPDGNGLEIIRAIAAKSPTFNCQRMPCQRGQCNAGDRQQYGICTR